MLPTYVINLLRSKDRRDAIATRLAELQIPAEVRRELLVRVFISRSLSIG